MAYKVGGIVFWALDRTAGEGMLTHCPCNDQSHSPERRKLLRWLGAASLILPTALAGCANSIPPRQIKRSRSHIYRKGSP
jgi:hypothetical protein